jgi:hypothetical protein
MDSTLLSAVYSARTDFLPPQHTQHYLTILQQDINMPKSRSTNTSFADLVPEGYRVTLGRGEAAPSEARGN